MWKIIMGWSKKGDREGRPQDGEKGKHGEDAVEKDLPGGLKLSEALAAGGL